MNYGFRVVKAISFVEFVVKHRFLQILWIGQTTRPVFRPPNLSEKVVKTTANVIISHDLQSGPRARI